MNFVEVCCVKNSPWSLLRSKRQNLICSSKFSNRRNSSLIGCICSCYGCQVIFSPCWTYQICVMLIFAQAKLNVFRIGPSRTDDFISKNSNTETSENLRYHRVPKTKSGQGKSCCRTKEKEHPKIYSAVAVKRERKCLYFFAFYVLIVFQTSNVYTFRCTLSNSTGIPIIRCLFLVWAQVFYPLVFFWNESLFFGKSSECTLSGPPFTQRTIFDHSLNFGKHSLEKHQTWEQSYFGCFHRTFEVTSIRMFKKNSRKLDFFQYLHQPVENHLRNNGRDIFLHTKNQVCSITVYVLVYVWQHFSMFQEVLEKDSLFWNHTLLLKIRNTLARWVDKKQLFFHDLTGFSSLLEFLWELKQGCSVFLNNYFNR